MSPARPEILAYVESTFPGARVEPLAGDVSRRRFFRIRPTEGAARVLMDYGREFEGETDDVVMARILGRAGLPVARVLDVNGRAGCLLLEDLGDRTLQSALAELGAAAQPMLERAVRLAAVIARKGTPVLARSERADGPTLDEERFRFEMDFFLEHYVRGLCDQKIPVGLREALHALAAAATETPRRVLCHRDFHSRNLLLLDDGNLAMVDIQDARWGPDAYDLASLLRDAYVDIHESWIDPLIDLYLAGPDAPPEEDFRSRFDVVSCQRMIKALGTFGSLRDSADAGRYLDAIPRTLERLRRILPTQTEIHPVFVALSDAGLLHP